MMNRHNGYHALDEDERLVLELFLEAVPNLTARRRFMLGMVVSALFMEPGQRRTREELAAFAGVSRQAIEQRELKGLRKCRAWLYQDKELSRELEQVFNR